MKQLGVGSSNSLFNLLVFDFGQEMRFYECGQANVTGKEEFDPGSVVGRLLLFNQLEFDTPFVLIYVKHFPFECVLKRIIFFNIQK